MKPASVQSTAICIRRLGWLSRGKAGPDETSTSDDAWTLLTPPSSGEGLRGHNQWVERNNLVYQDRDREQAEAALEWARALPTEGVVDYIYNLGVACRADNVVYKTMGLVASALVAHANHLNRQAEIVQRKKDDAGKARGWVGEVKDRVLFTHMEVLYMRYVEGRWGTSTLVAFEDPVGNLYKWFSSRSLDDLNVGDVVSVKGTIKKHSEYKGVKETQLSRCQIA